MKETQINMIFACKEVCRGADVDSDIINATIRIWRLDLAIPQFLFNFPQTESESRAAI